MDKLAAVRTLRTLGALGKRVLNKKVKEMGLRGYAKLTKDELIEWIIEPPPQDVQDSTLSRAVLIEKAKEMGMRGCYKYKKGELIEQITLFQEFQPPQDGLDKLSLEELRKKAKEMGIQGRGRFNKIELIALI